LHLEVKSALQEKNIVKPAAWLIVFGIAFLVLALKARSAQVAYASTPGQLPAYAQVAYTTGIVFRSGRSSGAMLCMGTCVRLYGSSAPNGSREYAVGVWAGSKDGSFTVVKESWTRS
jgi:hypothetical protein